MHQNYQASLSLEIQESTSGESGSVGLGGVRVSVLMKQGELLEEDHRTDMVRVFEPSL